MDGKVFKYASLIHKAGEIDGAYVVFPYDIRKEFGRGRVNVHATFDGEPYDGSIVNMGVRNADGSACYTTERCILPNTNLPGHWPAFSKSLHSSDLRVAGKRNC